MNIKSYIGSKKIILIFSSISFALTKYWNYKINYKE